MTEPAIKVKDLRRVFGDENPKKGPNKVTGVDNSVKVAVNSISFEVKKGEIFGILGPNGAGKTTTIRMLSTLLKPSGGIGEVLGIDVADDRRTRELRRRINMVSGGERGLYYRLTGRQNLRYFADLYGVPKNIREERIDRTLELVKMTEAADKRVEEYSRGMKQRIHIARALINDPEVLFLDEPTIGLDPEISKQIRKIVKDLSDQGKTIILTTHYMFEAEELCDRMILLKKGNIVGYGTIDELNAKVSDDAMVRVITASDPSSKLEELNSIDDITDVRVTDISGRYVVNVRCKKESDIIDTLNSIFDPFGIRSIGFDDPTLEETYLFLTGGE
jgi:ABC-2 type transport system ATP-binding protein